MADLFVAQSVRARLVEGRTVLLVIESGDYIILDRAATLMWTALTTLEESERLNFLADRLEADRSRLAGDLAAFERDCIERGYLASEPARPRPYSNRALPPAPPSALRAWFTLFGVSRRLRASFAIAYGDCLELAKPDTAVDPETLARAEAAFLSAENMFIHKAAPRDCLPRSLSLYRFLLSCGIRADHCIGVSRFPFEAHAWVECEGRILLDRAEWVEKHAEIARI